MLGTHSQLDHLQICVFVSRLLGDRSCGGRLFLRAAGSCGGPEPRCHCCDIRPATCNAESILGVLEALHGEARPSRKQSSASPRGSGSGPGPLKSWARSALLTRYLSMHSWPACAACSSSAA